MNGTHAMHETVEIPGPRGSRCLGSLHEFRSGMLEFFERCRAEYGPICLFKLGGRRMVLLSEPKWIEQVLVKQNKSFQKHFAVRLLRPVLGNGLLLSEGRQWLRQRRLIQPGFSRQFHDDLAGIVKRHTGRLAEDWRRAPRRDLYRDMTQLTVRIAAEAFLGVSSEDDSHEVAEHLEVIHADFEHRFQQLFNLPVWLPTRRNRRLRSAVRGLTDIIDRMIVERQRDAAERRDALALMLQARDETGKGMPRKLLRDEVMTLLLAGHDTTANALTWTWYLLAQHPEAVDALRAEWTQEPTQPDTQLPYTDAVIRESMRLYPPVYLFGREAMGPVQLGDYRLREGDTVVMSQWVVHRDARYYEDPLAFRPQRWLSGACQDNPHYAYFPFGGGPRVCLGKDAAMVEAAVILSGLAGAFQVDLEDHDAITAWPTVTLRPSGPVWAHVSPVTQTQPRHLEKSR